VRVAMMNFPGVNVSGVEGSVVADATARFWPPPPLMATGGHEPLAIDLGGLSITTALSRFAPPV
jgi:hypothetical protein